MIIWYKKNEDESEKVTKYDNDQSEGIHRQMSFL